MAAFAFHALALFLLKNDDLGPSLVFQDCRGDRSTGETGFADPERLTFTSGEDVLNLYGRAFFGARIAVHSENVALGHSELLALGFDGRFHK